MGKGLAWSESETIQLCLSWLEVSEDAVRGAGQKKSTFSSRLYSHWLENKRPEDKDPRTEVAIMGRWKKLQPEVTKFCGVYAKVTSRESSGWNDAMYLDAALKVYQERHKQPFEFLAAWKELKDKPKWTNKITSASSIGVKRG
ncbi:Glutathione S-transferase T3 [Phytophthora nicotianae]|uniref:Glutathione S-transferase T3 n=1 Tax=Phytophthora nicotianae TaxID=4792 RepID=A0A0W8BFY0_PHYNI|nr:Glutathione S-transferase T3 [Phytophthora nicotianae]